MKLKLLLLTLFIFIHTNSFANIKALDKAIEENNQINAEQAFKTLTDLEKQSLEGKILQGRLYLLQEESEDAFDHFEALQKNNTEHIDINYYLGVSAVIMAQKASIFSKLGYAKDFIKAMNKTIALKPDHQEALITLIGFHLNAPSIAGADTELALQYAQQLKQYFPEMGYSQIATVYWQTERPELGDKTLNEALQLYPNSFSLYFYKALNNINNESWQLARDDLNKALEYSQDNEDKSQALYQLGKVAVKSEQAIDSGIEALKQGIKIADNTRISIMKYRLAQLYVLNDQLSKARDLIATITINNDELKDRLKKLNKKIKKRLKKQRKNS